MLRRRPRRTEPDPQWEAIARAHALTWRHLDAEGRDRLLDQARTLDRTRYWEGLGGLVVTPAMRAHIAAQACILTVNIGLRGLADVTSILVAPSSSFQTSRQRVGGSIVSESAVSVLGEARLHGPVRLAWDQIEAELDDHATSSVVIHEFAHKVDMADGAADGTPPIGDRSRSLAFEQVADATLDELRSGAPGSALRTYAATNRTELFAVASEAFFLRPAALRSEFGDLYEVLADFYRQRPDVT
jgi:Mlc titration factor MtfA (ptsG expression regulator)